MARQQRPCPRDLVFPRSSPSQEQIPQIPGVTAEQAAAVFLSQPPVLLKKLNQKLPGVCPREHHRKGLVVNAGHVAAGTVDAYRGGPGRARDQRGAALGRLEPGALRAPWVLREGAAQAVYVARESARVQVSSAAGGQTLLLDEEVAPGSVFVVPRFAVAFVAAGGPPCRECLVRHAGDVVHSRVRARPPVPQAAALGAAGPKVAAAGAAAARILAEGYWRRHAAVMQVE